MSDQLLMENYLLILKSNMEVYIHGTLESVNEDVRNGIHLSMEDTLDSQNNTFHLMNGYGFYRTENIDTKTIKKAYKKLEK